MALDKDVLGQTLYDALTAFNNKDITATGSIEDARLAFAKATAGAIIDHFTTNAIIPSAGLVAPSGGGPVTGTAKIT